MNTKPKPKTQRDLPGEICATLKAMAAERTLDPYTAQWFMVGEVANRMDLATADEIQQAIQVAAQNRRLKTGGDPVHSISLIYRWNKQ